MGLCLERRLTCMMENPKTRPRLSTRSMKASFLVSRMKPGLSEKRTSRKSASASNQTVSRLNMAGSRRLGDGLKRHAHWLGGLAGIVQPLKPDDPPLAVFHQHHFFARFLANVFRLWTAKPDG